MRKPIIQAKGTGNYKYKNCFTAFALGVTIAFVKLVDEGLTHKEI